MFLNSEKAVSSLIIERTKVYLENRDFSVGIKKEQSTTGRIEGIIPLESVLDPLLFYIYIMDETQQNRPICT